MTNGFHASASNATHLYLDEIDKSLLQQEEWEADNKNGNKNITDNKTSSNKTFALNDNIKIYPNPTNGIFGVNFNNQYSINNIQFSITDLTGKTVYLKEENKSQNTNFNYQINISDKPNGINVLKILCDNKIYLTKIIKQ